LLTAARLGALGGPPGFSSLSGAPKGVPPSSTLPLVVQLGRSGQV